MTSEEHDAPMEALACEVAAAKRSLMAYPPFGHYPAEIVSTLETLGHKRSVARIALWGLTGDGGPLRWDPEFRLRRSP